MRASISSLGLRLLPALALGALLCGAAQGQRHNFGSAPPTAPPQKPATPAQPVVPVSSGMGALQFVTVNYGVPAPQALSRQLRSDDERTRAAALSAVGAPGQYLQRGHIGMARSISLDLVNLSNADELDAVLTVELDQHILSAILVPDESNWRRIATMIFATSFDDPRTTPATFAHLSRSFLAPDRYRVIFNADTATPNGDYVENEAHLRVINGHAIIITSFSSGSRECASASAQPAVPGSPSSQSKRPERQERPEPPGTCNVMRRWLTQDNADPTHRFFMVTGTGRFSAHEAGEIGTSQAFETAHLRTFNCQPFIFSDSTLRFEPTGPNGTCSAEPHR